MDRSTAAQAIVAPLATATQAPTNRRFALNALGSLGVATLFGCGGGDTETTDTTDTTGTGTGTCVVSGSLDTTWALDAPLANCLSSSANSGDVFSPAADDGACDPSRTSTGPDAGSHTSASSAVRSSSSFSRA